MLLHRSPCMEIYIPSVGGGRWLVFNCVVWCRGVVVRVVVVVCCSSSSVVVWCCCSSIGAVVVLLKKLVFKISILRFSAKYQCLQVVLGLSYR